LALLRIAKLQELTMKLYDDFDVKYPEKATSQELPGFIAPADDPRNKRQVQQIVEKIPITVSNPIFQVLRRA
jgi:hypothetical protein